VEETSAQAERQARRLGCQLNLAFFVVCLLSVGLILFLVVIQAPPGVIGLIFFTPFLLFFVVLLMKGRGLMKQLARARPSPERRAVRPLDPVGRTAPPPEQAPPPDGDWPTVPKLDRLTYPGRTLAVALQAERNPAWALACLVPFTAVWIGFVSLFAIPVIHAHQRGKPDWCSTLVLVPFALGAVVMLTVIALLVFKLIVGLLVGRISVELSAHPLKAGGRYLVLVEQAGAVPLRQVRISLVCQESATYTAGTSNTTTTREVYAHELADTSPGLDTGLAGGTRRTLEVPASAMHSFASGHNKITWKVVVRGRVAGLPARSNFPVIIYPAGWEEGT
jgi:hypothetical protein